MSRGPAVCAWILGSGKPLVLNVKLDLWRHFVKKKFSVTEFLKDSKNSPQKAQGRLV